MVCMLHTRCVHNVSKYCSGVATACSEWRCCVFFYAHDVVFAMLMVLAYMFQRMTHSTRYYTSALNLDVWHFSMHCALNAESNVVLKARSWVFIVQPLCIHVALNGCKFGYETIRLAGIGWMIVDFTWFGLASLGSDWSCVQPVPIQPVPPRPNEIRPKQTQPNP